MPVAPSFERTTRAVQLCSRGVAATRPRKIRVAAAASRRPVRGISASQPRRRRDSSQRDTKTIESGFRLFELAAKTIENCLRLAELGRRSYGMALSRLLLPLYLLCVPDALPRLLVVPSPDAASPTKRYALAAALVAWQGIQVGLLKLQQTHGARCFVPDFLIPKPYDYQRDVGPLIRAARARGDGDDDGPECAICMGPIDVVTGAYMVTPCDHLFHEICLSQWMDLKMECPVCRASLPPVGGDGEEADDSSGSESPPRNGPRDPLLNP